MLNCANSSRDFKSAFLSLLTSLSDNYVNIRTIQAIARHSHLNTTARYLSVTDTQIKNAVNLVF